MPWLSAPEAKIIFAALFSFLRGHLAYPYNIDVHGIWVTGRVTLASVVGGIFVEQLGRDTGMLIGSSIGNIPLKLEVNCFSIPIFNSGWDGIH